MADVSDKPWGQFSDADYPDAQDYCDASLVNMNEGPRSSWTKTECKLRVHEPKGGPLNRNGIHAAAVRLAGGGGGVDLPPEEKRAAARKLVSLYRNELKEDPPEAILRMARG